MFKPHPKHTVQYGFSPIEYHNLGADVPRGDPKKIMSRSELMEFARCPQRWLHGVPNDSTTALDWGSVMDCIVLTPERFEDCFIVSPETYPAKGKKKDDPIEHKPWNRNAIYCQEWEAAHKSNGKQIVKAEVMESAKTAAGRVFADERLNDFLRSSKRQAFAMAEWHDEATGLTIPVKILVDLVPLLASPYGDSLGDFKTSNTASPRAWVKHVFEYSLHQQAGFYLDVWNVATGEKRTGFYHPLQESFPPYETARRKLTQQFINIGRIDYIKAIEDYCQCLKTGIFPGYEERRYEGSQVIDGWREVEPADWMLISEPE